MAVDLNNLRQKIIDAQRIGETRPSDPAKQVVVDREGRVRTGDQVRPSEPITQVQQDTFAAAAAR